MSKESGELPRDSGFGQDDLTCDGSIRIIDSDAIAAGPGGAPHFARVSAWAPDMRYHPGAINQREAEAFVAATDAIFRWADGRL